MKRIKLNRKPRFTGGYWWQVPSTNVRICDEVLGSYFAIPKSINEITLCISNRSHKQSYEMIKDMFGVNVEGEHNMIPLTLRLFLDHTVRRGVVYHVSAEYEV